MDRKVDAQLVLDYKSGDQAALAKLVKRWHKPFCNKAYWIVNDPDLAKDVAQDAWTTIISRIHSLKDNGSFGGWALKIVCSKSLDQLRKDSRKRIKKETYKKELETKMLVDVEKDDQLLKMRVLESIKQLPQHQQTVIRLFYVEDYSLKEIGNMMNISVGTAKSRLFHARETLKKSLKNKNYEK